MVKTKRAKITAEEEDRLTREERPRTIARIKEMFSKGAIVLSQVDGPLLLFTMCDEHIKTMGAGGKNMVVIYMDENNLVTFGTPKMSVVEPEQKKQRVVEEKE